MQMPKIIKIIISILIAISIAVNPFCGVFNVNASADAGTIVGFAFGIGFLVAGFASELLEAGIPQRAFKKLGADLAEAETGYKILADKLFTNNDYIVANYHYDGHVNIEAGDYVFQNVSINPDSNLSGSELAMAQLIVDGINERIASGSNPDLVLDKNPLTGDYCINPDTYATLKEIVCDTIIKDMYSNVDFEVGDIIADVNDVPVYNFDFVGPIPTMTIPTSTGQVSLTTNDGFLYGIPVHSSSFNDVGRFKTPSAAYQFYKGLFPECTPDSFTGNDSDGYYAHNWFLFANGTSLAFFYNDDVYYYEIQKYLNGYTAEINGFTVWYNYDLSTILSRAKNAKGEILGDIATVNSDFSVSLCANKESKVASSMPISTVNYEDFEQTTGGGTVEIPLTPAEQVVAEALKLGLLSDDSMLTIGEDGAITAADGIDLATIETLLERIANGQLEFEDIQQYLDLITQLIGAGNLTESEQKTLLVNIENLTQAQAKDISEIKDLIKSMTDEAEKEIVIDNELELEAPDVTIIDRFPFCLPFDLYRIFSLLCAEPKEPVFEIPINVNIGTGGLNFEIDEKIVLDLTIFRLHGYDMVRIFANSTSILIFIICLIAGTKKFIWK